MEPVFQTVFATLFNNSERAYVAAGLPSALTGRTVTLARHVSGVSCEAVFGGRCCGADAHLAVTLNSSPESHFFCAVCAIEELPDLDIHRVELWEQ